MYLAILFLTLVCLLFTIGSGSIIYSLIKENNGLKQYVPTQPTRKASNTLNNITELEQDIVDQPVLITDYFDDDDKEVLELGMDIFYE